MKKMLISFVIVSLIMLFLNIKGNKSLFFAFHQDIRDHIIRNGLKPEVVGTDIRTIKLNDFFDWSNEYLEYCDAYIIYSTPNNEELEIDLDGWVSRWHRPRSQQLTQLANNEKPPVIKINMHKLGRTTYSLIGCTAAREPEPRIVKGF